MEEAEKLKEVRKNKQFEEMNDISPMRRKNTKGLKNMSTMNLE